MAEAASPQLHLDDLADREREAVEALLFRLADDELVLAERYTEWQVRSPTLESDIALANIAQDELGHARLWYQLLQRFEYDEPDLIYERDAGDFRHSTLAELPFPEGDWADAIVRSFLYDVAEDVRLHAIQESSVPAIRDRVEKVLQEEDYHLDHAHSWLERLAGVEDGHGRLQAAVDRLFPHALTLFEPVGDVETAIDELGIRDRSLDEMREEWLTRVGGTLEGLGIEVPAAEPADPAGRDGEHTEHWEPLHAEMVETYHDLGRDSATTIMEPDDAQ
ncbi:phenylacetic acid degradation protein PaaC [Salinarchaeum sp. Harcht-Bsk1]|uniref:1,2-phenylacetyl-CoA epoxidase subunit PaaC n=1 Tax=Salinarchaeum sp. Harcht-Bsk1 TaxID=1333523 RepID=UPI000342346E|nr:1,2-phenylacetyl-CoA epoxidase subunit PaaC [Salinarchaeum sp. Harcht-Bsk1]AGN00432.1 phenylacetic acid degradation protein PaaC [Salinarchaeum sp. Harcht-Bsk1]